MENGSFGAVSNEQYTWEPVSYENYVDENSDVMLYYLDAREVKKQAPFLNFDINNFNGNVKNYQFHYSNDLSVIYASTKGETYDASEDNATLGIHTRGCGVIPPSQMRNSVYDYVALIQQAAAKEGLTLSKADIYGGAYDAQIQNYIEDLIVDEEALELAFEGTRFFDLMRVAHRRGDASYLAKRVSQRSGSVNSALYNKLLDTKNWYFPLPQY